MLRLKTSQKVLRINPTSPLLKQAFKVQCNVHSIFKRVSKNILSFQLFSFPCSIYDQYYLIRIFSHSTSNTVSLSIISFMLLIKECFYNQFYLFLLGTLPTCPNMLPMRYLLTLLSNASRKTIKEEQSI